MTNRPPKRRWHPTWCAPVALVALVALVGVVAVGCLLWLTPVTAAHDPAFDSGPIEPGDNWTLDTSRLAPGRYDYTSRSLDWLQGILRVAADSDNATRTWNITVLEGTSADRYHFEPNDLHVEQGDLVVWHNTGAHVHSATEGPWEPWPGQDGPAGDDHGHHGPEGGAPAAPLDLRPLVALSLLSLAAALYVWAVRLRRRGL